MKSFFTPAALGGLLALSVACQKPPEPLPRYTDPAFGFSFTYPRGWTIDDRAGAAIRQRLPSDVGVDAGEIEELLKQQRELVSLKLTNAKGQVGGRLSVFTAQATPAEFLAGYLATLKSGIKDTTTTEVLEQKQGVPLGGKSYELARLSVKVPGGLVHQELYVTAAGKQAVMFSITSNDADQLAQLKATISSMTWAEPTRPAP